MSKTIPPIKGMKDLLPEFAPYWHRLEDAMKQVFASFDYREIRTPILEHTELFKRGVGEVTDIVEKEMYTFEDRNGASLSLRPENTASCVRAGLSNGLLHNQRHRFWYYGPMFRHENPQKGRYRQFFQFGAEAFGFEGPAVDVELIQMSAALWQALQIPGLKLEINSIGTPSSRQAHREKLIAFFSKHESVLDEDSKRRLQTNPLRILDSKNPSLQSVIEQAPRLSDHLDPESVAHFDQFKELLNAAGIEYSENHRLVRGLDYYTRTVFEWVTQDLGAQSAVCAGGRYDGLVEQLGGKPMPAVGWSLGVERVVELMKIHGSQPANETPQAFLIVSGDEAQIGGLKLAHTLRTECPGLRLANRGGEGGYKAQFKAAVSSGAEHLIIVRADNAGAEGELSYKNLRENGPESKISVPDLIGLLAKEIE